MTKGIWICGERRCDWRGPESALLSAPNPFEPTENIYACPECKAIDNYAGECEIEGCTSIASCGTPTKAMGYIRCCGEHYEEFGVLK